MSRRTASVEAIGTVVTHYLELPMRPSPGLLTLSLLAATASACTSDTPSPTEARAAVQAAHAPASIEASSPFSIAVIGDTPYGAVKLAEFPRLVAQINADPLVELVTHVGDIKAGKNAACSDAYFATVRALFDTFADPFVYTPGDNEWTDCHVDIKNNGLFVPTERLQAVRRTFFPKAGVTLGQRAMKVTSQPNVDPQNGAYVENVSWTRGGVVFATVNITGSNNDLASWGTRLPDNAWRYPTQQQEVASRNLANAAWIAAAFRRAALTNAPAIVLAFQADMWDPAEPTLAGYDAYVQQIGTLAAQFGKPVLLLEGDSHVFLVDQPFTVASPFHALHASTPIAPNVTRIVMEGSDKGRTEYLRLTIDPSATGAAVFSWTRVPLI